MKLTYIVMFFLLIRSIICNSQTFLNGSFEKTTSPDSCNYNISNYTFNKLMQNTIAFGVFESVDIVVSGCYIPNVSDGKYAIAIANNPTNNIEGEALSLELSSSLISGINYTITFDAYSITEFSPQGNLLIGFSDSNKDFGVEIYNATTEENQWTSFTFSFSTPYDGKYITVMPASGFTSWNCIDNFSLESPLAVVNFEYKESFDVYPNPSSDFITISGLTKIANYKIYNAFGQEVLIGSVHPEYDRINIQYLSKGLYFIEVEYGKSIKFLKE